MDLFVEKWVTFIDERTCERCRQLDGKLYLSGTGPEPPLHPRCRCRRVFVDMTREEFLEAARNQERGG